MFLNVNSPYCCLIFRCDGLVQLDVFQEEQVARISNMPKAAMDYAYHEHAHVTITVQKRTLVLSIQDLEPNALVLKLHYNDIRPQSVMAHFDIDHRYFQRLHDAVRICEDSTLNLIVPDASEDMNSASQISLENLGRFTLDAEYQRKALRQMLSCKPTVPYLLLGPFGTGKSHLLAAAVVKLIENSANKVLVCTHLNRGADGLYKTIQKHLRQAQNFVVRLVPNEEAAINIRIPQPFSFCIANVARPFEVQSYPVILSTFQTALWLSDVDQLEFTHILLDEGAQSPEPEALAALSVATSNTKIIIVGDNKQVNIVPCAYALYVVNHCIFLYTGWTTSSSAQ